MKASRTGFQLLLLASALVHTQLTWSCTCDEDDVKTAKQNADVIFSGRVLSITFVDDENAWEPRIVAEFAVEKVWKGPVGKVFTMHTNFESSSCTGFYREVLVVGQELIVYGYGESAKGWKQNGLEGAPNSASYTVRGRQVVPVRPDLLSSIADDRKIYSTNICTRTAPLANASEDIKKLGKPIDSAR